MPAPIAAPPKGPNGVISPKRPPVIPKLPISGAAFWNISYIFLDMIPPSRPVTLPSSSLIALPNITDLKVSLFVSIDNPAPATAPITGPNPVSIPAPAPITPAAAFLPYLPVLSLYKL